ncbi:MAG: RNA methyltransferase substrate-binding domain-containing protein, partial [Desulfobacterales bacterium]
MKSELLYGIHPVFEALAAGRRRVYEIYLDKEKTSSRLTQIESMAEARDVLKKRNGPGDFKALTGTIGHQ